MKPKLYSFCGQSFSLRTWAERSRLNYHTLKSRLRRGWSFDRAIFEPANFKRKKQFASDDFSAIKDIFFGELLNSKIGGLENGTAYT